MIHFLITYFLFVILNMAYFATISIYTYKKCKKIEIPYKVHYKHFIKPFLFSFLSLFGTVMILLKALNSFSDKNVYSKLSNTYTFFIGYYKK